MSTTLPSRPILLLRSTLFWLVFFTSTVVLTFPVVITSLFSERICNAIVQFWVNINLKGLELICKTGHTLEGRGNIPSEPVIIFSKHQSTWETLFIRWLFPNAVFVAKRELALIPFFGWSLASLDFVLINRKSGRRAIRQMVDQFRERKARGRYLVIFPEGTRKPVGAPPDYKIGGAVVAVETETPLLPIAVNSGEFWPRLSFVKWPGKITVSIGPLISPEGKTPELMREEAAEWIENKMAEITVIDRFPY